ncbi:hypothetical protein ACFPIJ_20890 [Dactylosporangium cerinum]|uniref:Uncharacterized protein n=1 Tax=Dactylosporangium cerinum TaxID=1434730 RepID=A0ABV9VWV2_9ACTN
MNQSPTDRGPASLWRRAAACLKAAAHAATATLTTTTAANAATATANATAANAATAIADATAADAATATADATAADAATAARTTSTAGRATVAAAIVAGVVFGTAAPAAAHDGVILTLHGDGHGSVWVTATWQDGHPVTEAAGITLLATTADGRRQGPAGLRRNGDALTFAGTLDAGDWTVVAEMGTPAIGRCQGVLHVAADGAPQDIVCAPPPAAATPPPATTTPKTSYTWVWYALGVAALAGLAAWLFHRKSIAARAAARRTPSRKASTRRTTTRRK